MTIDPIARLIADREIRDLAVHYSIAVDDGDIPGVLDCFTESGSFERAGHVVESHAALGEFFGAMTERYALTRHVVDMQTLDPFDVADRATGLVHGSAELVLGDTLYRVAYRYNDRYEVEGGKWRFASRKLRFIYYLPARDAVEAVTEELRVRIPGTDPTPSEHLG